MVTIEWGGSGRAMGEAMKEAPGRALATVVFTDIVDSTRHVRELGDAAWRDQLARHNARMRESVNMFRGREVKSTGDGLLLLFETPTRAVRCVLAMVAASRELDIEIRAGIHHRRGRARRRRRPRHRGAPGGARRGGGRAQRDPGDDNDT